MMFQVILITEPTIDLGRFRKLIGNVNELDSLNLPPHAKFGRAVDELLDKDQFDGMGVKHLFYCFYFELPYNCVLDMQNYEAAALFRLSTIVENVMCRGMITAPLDMWRDFIRWAEGRTLVEPLAKAVEKQLPCR